MEFGVNLMPFGSGAFFHRAGRIDVDAAEHTAAK
jgi:hypothetical protein